MPAVVDARNFEAAIKFIPQFRKRRNDKATAILKLLYLIDGDSDRQPDYHIIRNGSSRSPFIDQRFVLIFGYMELSAWWILVDEVLGALMRLHNQYKRLFYIEVSLDVISNSGLVLIFGCGANITSNLLDTYYRRFAVLYSPRFLPSETDEKDAIGGLEPSPLRSFGITSRDISVRFFIRTLIANSRLR